MNLRVYWRFLVVVYQFLPLLAAYTRDRRKYLLFGGRRRVPPEVRRRRARKLLDSLITLGPTFVKLGQLLSTRPDILPPEYIDEFEQLQDDVPPAPWSAARQVLEAELGPVVERFDDVDTDAVSGASLGQVYTATVGGDAVAVKVRRPGVEDLVEADLRVIAFSLPIVLQFVDESRAFSMETLANEFAKVIREEMDYHRERKMLLEIRENFRGRPEVRIPRVLESHSTDRVLTMEYVRGTKISEIEDLDARGLDRTAVARTLQEVYLEMIVEHGVFHADPHPGNLGVQDDGTLVFYDFGMSGHVDPFVQEKIVDFYVAIARQDTGAILDTLIEMGTLSPEADRQVMANVMELAIADARGEEIEQYRLQGIISQVENTMYEFPLRLPPNLALVLRVATVVEGVCVTLDPEYDFIEVATDFLRDRGYLERGAREYAEETAEQLGAAARSSVLVPPKLETALETVNREDLTVQVELQEEELVVARLARRLVHGMVLSALLLATTVLYAFASLEATAVAGGAAVVVLGLLYRSFRKRRGFRARPQFTRQQMRQRRQESDHPSQRRREE